MDFESILYADIHTEVLSAPPAFFQDLQLEYLLGIIERDAKGYNIRPHFYTFPGSEKMIRYRQEIFQDLSDRKLYDDLEDFCLQMQRSRDSYSLSLQCEEEIQRASYYLEAASIYWKSILFLSESLNSAKLASEGMHSLQNFLNKEITEKRNGGFEQGIRRACEFFSQIRFRLNIEEDRITIAEETIEPDNYLENLAKVTGKDVIQTDMVITGIFPNRLEPSCLEMTLVNLLWKSNPGIFHEIKSFYHNYPEFYAKPILRFEEEIPVYLSFLKFREKTENLGFALRLPQLSSRNEFQGSGLYDLALVWKNANRDYRVVSNEFSYPEHSSFFVVTGPNQGGKTTFARSMGQAVYFSMMGMYANAEELTIPFFRDIATHFEVEEQLQSNSGKLKEEINRLAPMMKGTITNQFVILNELFTTATTHDALIMGKEVMKHFLGKECYGIYVTHIQELAEETEQIISLAAQIREEKEQRRTYRILPMKAKGYGYSESLVKEFELRYEDIKRRLSR